MKDSNLEPVYDLFRYFLIGGGAKTNERFKISRSTTIYVHFIVV